MKLVKFLLGVVCIGILSVAEAQQISKINFTTITSAATDPASRYHYPKLFTRYKRNDTTLSKVDYKYLYYGQTAMNWYQPYGKNPKKQALSDALQQNDYQKAIAIGKEILVTKPLDVNAVFGVYVGYSGLKNAKESKLWEYKFRRLVDAILDSGDGLSQATAYVVADASDELVITGMLELDVTKQAVVENKWDLLDIAQPNEYKIKQLYFNIEKPLGSLSRKETAKK